MSDNTPIDGRELIAGLASRLHHLSPSDNTTREMLDEFDRWLNAKLAAAYDEGAEDGVWNYEHKYVIDLGLRAAIPHPYRPEATS